MKILVTGGAGFIGSNITNHLEKIDTVEKIFVIDNLTNGRIENVLKSPKVSFRKGDICDPEFMEEMCEKVDVICHQAAWGSVPRSIEQPKDYMQNNVFGFAVLVESAKKAGVKKIIYASSSSVYGDNDDIVKIESNIGTQLSPYALSKRFDEMLADNFHQLYGIDFFGLRYFNVFGENQRWDSEYSAVIPLFINAIMNDKSPTIFGDGCQSRDFTYVKNVVDFNINLILNQHPTGSHKLNVGFGESTSVNQLFEIISNKIGKDIKPIYKEKRVGEIMNSLSDISESKKFGYNPEISLQEGLDKTIEWFINR
jgi:UDP-N-acetylglucosamine 4-epimerase